MFYAWTNVISDNKLWSFYTIQCIYENGIGFCLFNWLVYGFTVNV